MPNTPCQVTRGIVLRETETKEADKILTVLTAERGRLSIKARGARRKNSPLLPAGEKLRAVLFCANPTALYTAATAWGRLAAKRGREMH